MAHDIFISYSTADKTTADAVCHSLEAAGLRCWIAPRDATPGHRYQGSIIRAIRECRVMVLLFTAAANRSEHVFRELHAASEHSKPIIPFRTENVVPSDDVSYYLGPLHWLDALTEPLEQHIDRLMVALRPFAAPRAQEPVEGSAHPPGAESEPSIPAEPTRKRHTEAGGARENSPAHAGTVTLSPPAWQPLPPEEGPRTDPAPDPAREHSPAAAQAGGLGFSAACGALAATAYYGLEGWGTYSFTAWFANVIVFTSMFVGMAAAGRWGASRFAPRLAGAAAGWVGGHLASWLFFAFVRAI